MENIEIRKITCDEGKSAMALALGFLSQGEEQTLGGIRFTPMKYIIKR